jgi:transposase
MILPRLGNDMAKLTFNACLLNKGKSYKRQFKNDDSGFRALSLWLLSLGCPRVQACQEATGRYGDRLAKYLYEQGHKVSVVNARLIKNHAAALGKHNKTDDIDAYVIAHYAQCHELKDWQPKSQIQIELNDIVGQIAILKKTLTALKTRQTCELSAFSSDINRETIAFLEAKLGKLKEHGMTLLSQDQQATKNYEIVDSVPGIGPEVAFGLAAKIDFKNFATGRDLACFLGVSPREWQSGTSVKRKGKITKAGDKQLRALVRAGALAATYSSHFYRPFVERLRQKGKAELEIITAVTRKMLLIAHALVRKQQFFDKSYQHPLAQAA